MALAGAFTDGASTARAARAGDLVLDGGVVAVAVESRLLAAGASCLLGFMSVRDGN